MALVLFCGFGVFTAQAAQSGAVEVANPKNQLNFWIIIQKLG